MITSAHLRKAITLSGFDGDRARQPMVPGTRPFVPSTQHPPRESAVLMLVYPRTQMRGALHIVLTRRTDTLRGHSGQVSFPGGRMDPDDVSYVETALRETCEELNVCNRAQLHVLGELQTCYIPPSNYNVRPIVALMSSEPIMTPNPVEVAEVFSLSLEALLDPASKHSEPWTFYGQTVDVPFYLVQGHKVWGATAMMLSDLEQRLRLVLSQI